MPKCESKPTKISWKIPQEKGKNFVDVVSGITKNNPAANAYDVKMPWLRTGPKNIKGGKKSTYIDLVIEYEEKYKFPSSQTVSRATFIPSVLT